MKNKPLEFRWSPTHPVIASTPEEIARLRAAYRDGNRFRPPVSAMVRSATQARREPLEFPPRGGQHNQWYQCDNCQVPLETVEATRHRCPNCQKIYSGAPYDDVIFKRIHIRNLARMHVCAWAYAITHKPEFADSAKQILLGYAQRYRKYPYHLSRPDNQNTKSGGHLDEQTLDEAVSLATRIAPAYDLIHDWPDLSDDHHRIIREGLLMPMLENIEKNKGGKSNWQTWHNAGMLWGGAVLRDRAWIEKAVNDPDNGFFRQMQISVSTEGMWYENSWGYHFYALQAMTAIAEGARRLGVDLWRHPSLKAMCELPLRYIMPDGSLPRFGDDVKTGLDTFQPCFEAAFQSYRDETLLPHLESKPSWASVMYDRESGGPIPGKRRKRHNGCELFRGAGHAILRARGRAGLTAALTFGPYGGFHGHFDKLSFILFGYKTELGVDPGRAASQAYRMPIHKNWYKPSISHNTVLVDGQSQTEAAGTIEFFAAKPTLAVAMAACDTAYPGVRHRRLLALTPGYLLVVDQLDADNEHRFDWLYHNRGSSVFCDAATTPGMPDAEFQGGEYIANIRSGMTDQLIRVRYENGSVTTYLTMAAASGTTVMTSDGPGAAINDRIPMTIIGRYGRQTEFAAAIEPVRDAPPAVTHVSMTRSRNAMEIEVRRGAVTDVFSVATGNRARIRCNGRELENEK